MNLIVMILISVNTCKIQMRTINAFNKSHIKHVDMKPSHSEMIEILFNVSKFYNFILKAGFYENKKNQDKIYFFK